MKTIHIEHFTTDKLIIRNRCDPTDINMLRDFLKTFHSLQNCEAHELLH
jgi:hypothetical protein